MGTETHRETKRVTGMGCRTSAAVEPEPNRPIRRLGAKDLTGGVGFLPSIKTIHYLLQLSLLSYFSFFSTPWTCASATVQQIVTYMTIYKSHEHAARDIRYSQPPRVTVSAFACVNPRTERNTSESGPQTFSMTFAIYIQT